MRWTSLHVRSKLLLPVLIGLLVLIVLQAALTIALDRRADERDEIAHLHTDLHVHQNDVEQMQMLASTIAADLTDRATIVDALLHQDRRGMYTLLSPTYQRLNAQYGDVQLYVHDANGLVFLRMHDPQAYGDHYSSYRMMLNDATASRRDVAGIEPDRYRLGIRGVAPLIAGQKLIGFVEVALGYDQTLLQRLKAWQNVDYCIWLDYDAVSPSGLWPQPAQRAAAPHPDLFFYAATIVPNWKLPKDVYAQALHDGVSQVRFVSSGDQHLAVQIAPIRGYGGQILGVIEIVADRAAAIAALQRKDLITLALAAGVGFLALSAMAVLVFRVVQRPLHHLSTVTARQINGDRDARVQLLPPDEYGQLGHSFNLLTDQRNQAQEQLARAKEAAEAANQAKDRFIATLSHELRTPLTPALAILSSMETDPQLTDQMRDDLVTARRGVELESRLIDDLLDLSRIAHGRFQLQRKPLDLHVLIGDVTREAAPQAQSAGVKLELRLHAPHSVVDADGMRMRQVLWNLLKNSLRHTPADGVIRICTGNEPEDRISVTMIDTGEGISPDTLPLLFCPFELRSRKPSARHGELGLGLSICKWIMDEHGGSIAASSPGVGRGATFTLTLPLTHAPVPAPPAARPATPQTLPPLKILLVEDHEPTLRILQRMLTRIGLQVRVATSVRQALSVAQQGTFDLLISDLGLPDGNGVDIMAGLRHQPDLVGIALTGFGMPDDIEHTLNAGFAVHLVKPVSFERLKEAVIQGINTRQSHGLTR